MSKWPLLALAVMSEVAASVSLKAALDHPAFYAVVVAGYTTAFTCLILMLRKGAGLGVIYAIWAASGVALTSVLSSALYNEPLTFTMAGGIVLIIAGVFMVELGSQDARAHESLTPADEPAGSS